MRGLAMPYPRSPYNNLPPYNEDGKLNVVIETPKGSRNKFKFDKRRGMFILSKVLPAGLTFPYDFGYIPCTKGEDGDPLDVLILMDEPVFPGCLITARLIGVIRAKQDDDGDEVRNDRLIAIASHSHDQRNIHSIDELNQHLVEEIEHFFVSYHDLDGKKFEPIALLGPEKAQKIVKKGITGKYAIKREKQP
jgi:inorganic pyrophosphatase